ncbi:hypothetical protein NEOLEDRAFT_1151119 [Neolentinus lepideus HHB14362 ss-1]|uniref:Ubiquitin-like domain-containing protein n=1 Tax=Neolentinus lepideus HHB14362 ss-1 TaxID=1314782 RepID=A0A165PAY6_9AGAM|nr:hypothetical protein NEOLEDRAFT_1151119 [Neolentinus lepideus HHB14362 ss-1]
MSLVSLKVELPSHSLSFHVQVPSHSTVLDIKHEIHRACTGAPRVEGQKIIWRGRVLRDDERVDDLWKTPDESRVVHLAVHYSAWTSTPPENPTVSATSSARSGSPVNSSQQHVPPSLLPYPQFLPTMRFPQPLGGMSRPSLQFILHRHYQAIGTLMNTSLPLPNISDMVVARRNAVSHVESLGWIWPSVLDEEFPASDDEHPGLRYEVIRSGGQSYLSLTNPDTTPTPLQIHCLKVLSYTFPIILTSPYPSGPGPYSSFQAFALHGTPGDINQHLQRLGLPQIAANPAAAPPFMAEIRDIPLRALLAPLVMLAIRTLLLLYFISPARKPFIGAIIAAWVVYELWGAVRIALGYDVPRGANADNGNGQPQPAPRAAAGGNANVPPGPVPNLLQAAAGRMGRGRTRRNARFQSHTDMVLDMTACRGLDGEERALNAAPGSRMNPPTLMHKINAFLSLLFMTLHPEVWNRRRARLRQREGRIRTEINARENNNVSEVLEEEDEAQREERQRQQRVREDLIAQHQRRPIWVRQYIERVRRNEWLED